MCILLLTTAHPDYPLIVLNNRDEFLHRPTQPAAFWEPPYSHIFSGRDLARPERGTWLGITRSGRLAVLTNFCESSSAAAIGQKSRGVTVTSFLTSAETLTGSTTDWLRRLLAGGEMKGVGGFSLFCGTLRPNKCQSGGEGKGEGNLEQLAVICNRTAAGDDGIESGAQWIAGTRGETHGLSNSLFDDPWPKVLIGRQMLSETIQKSAGKPEDDLLEDLFSILSHDTMPVALGKHSYEMELEALRHSIFIPAFEISPETTQENGQPIADPVTGETVAPGIPAQLKPTPTPSSVKAAENDGAEPPVADDDTNPGRESGRWSDPSRLYGTQKQTVILLNKHGRVKFVERTLYDNDARPVEKKYRDIVCEFSIEGWND